MNIPCFALSIKAIHMKVLRIIHFNNEDYDFILEHFNKSLKHEPFKCIFNLNENFSNKLNNVTFNLLFE